MNNLVIIGIGNKETAYINPSPYMVYLFFCREYESVDKGDNKITNSMFNIRLT